MCLLELVSGLPPDRRTVPLALVAERTKLPADGVEFLLMKASWKPGREELGAGSSRERGEDGGAEAGGRAGRLALHPATHSIKPRWTPAAALLHVHAQTLALHLVEGVIDQVAGTVRVSWVQPRILTPPQARAPVNTRACTTWLAGMAGGRLLLCAARPPRETSHVLPPPRRPAALLSLRAGGGPARAPGRLGGQGVAGGADAGGGGGGRGGAGQLMG